MSRKKAKKVTTTYLCLCGRCKKEYETEDERNCDNEGTCPECRTRKERIADEVNKKVAANLQNSERVNRRKIDWDAMPQVNASNGRKLYIANDFI